MVNYLAPGGPNYILCEIHARTLSPKEELLIPGGRRVLWQCEECRNPEKFYESNLADQGIIIGNS